MHFSSAEKKRIKLSKGFGYSLLSVILMATAGPLNKYATLGASIEVVTFFSCFAALIGSTILVVYKKRWKMINHKNVSLILLSVLYTTAMLSFSFASKNENPAIVSLLSRSNIIFSFMISFFLCKEKFNLKIGFGLLLIILGTLLLISTSSGVAISIGTAAVIYYALAFSLHNGILKTLKGEIFIPVLVIQNFMASLCIFVFSENKEQFFHISSPSLVFAMTAGLLSSFLGFMFYQKGLILSTFSEATAVRSLGPVIALGVTYPFFPMVFDQLKIVGSILVLTGIVVFNIRQGPIHDKA